MQTVIALVAVVASSGGEPLPPVPLVRDDGDALAQVRAAKLELTRKYEEELATLDKREAALMNDEPRRLQQAGAVHHACPLESLLGLSPAVRKALSHSSRLWEKAARMSPLFAEVPEMHPSSRTALDDVFVRLQAFMTATPSVFLPTTIWGQGRGLKLSNDGKRVITRSSRTFGTLVDRMSIAAFVAEHTDLVANDAIWYVLASLRCTCAADRTQRPPSGGPARLCCTVVQCPH